MRNFHLTSTVHADKSKVEISQNFVAFSEYMNFTSRDNIKRAIQHSYASYFKSWEILRPTFSPLNLNFSKYYFNPSRVSNLKIILFLLALLNHALKHVEKWLGDFFEELQFFDRESRLEVRGMVFCYQNLLWEDTFFFNCTILMQIAQKRQESYYILNSRTCQTLTKQTF